MAGSVDFVIITDHSSADWAAELEALLSITGDVKIFSSQQWFEAETSKAQVLFVDALCGAAAQMPDSRARMVFLVLNEREAGVHELPAALRMGWADDVLLCPIRPLEVISKLKTYQQVLLWDEVSDLNVKFSDLVERMHEDLRLAERLQKARLPQRFPDVKGLQIKSRYLAGMRSGGDYFDLAEAGRGVSAAGQISMILTDSSSYGLASSVLSVLMRVAMKVSQDEARSAVETVKKIENEILATLGEKDQLSLFYGLIRRKDFEFKYTCLGSPRAFHSSNGKSFQRLEFLGKAISQKNPISKTLEGARSAEQTLRLAPSDRLVLLSDGFLEAVGGEKQAARLLDRFRQQDSADLLNELVYGVKSRFVEDDDMPEQDCTAIAIDVGSNLVRLAS